MRRNNNMDERFRFFLFLTFLVLKTYGMNVFTSIQNPEILPVVAENITLACTFKPSATYRQLSWIDRNNNILATCQGAGCTKGKNVTDMSKYSLRADSSSGNLTIRDLTVDDSGWYRCLVFTSSDSFSNGIELTVLLSSNVF